MRELSASESLSVSLTSRKFYVYETILLRMKTSNNANVYDPDTEKPYVSRWFMKFRLLFCVSIMSDLWNVNSGSKPILVVSGPCEAVNIMNFKLLKNLSKLLSMPLLL